MKLLKDQSADKLLVQSLSRSDVPQTEYPEIFVANSCSHRGKIRPRNDFAVATKTPPKLLVSVTEFFEEMDSVFAFNGA